MQWQSHLSRRSVLITFLLCGLMLYLTYTFNSCLVSNLAKLLKRSPIHSMMSAYPVVTPAPAYGGGAEVRLVPLLLPGMGGGEEAWEDGAPKYRFLRQQGLKPARRLPTALIIGVKKAGTRALLEFIRLHPDVRAAGSEIHFFDRFYNKGYQWYRERMPLTLDGQVTMEKTPSYFVTKSVPKRVQHMNPSMKLLMVVRDPVTRAISDYTQAARPVTKGPSSLAATGSCLRIDAFYSDDHSLRGLMSKKPSMAKFEELAFVNSSVWGPVDTSWGPVRLGVYARPLQRWLRRFPLAQMLLVSGERLVADPAAEMSRVQDFLNLKRVVTEKHFYFNSTKGFPCLFKSEGRSSPHCLGKTKGRSHPSISPAALQRLRDFYRPFNQRFYQLTGINFGWP